MIVEISLRLTQFMLFHFAQCNIRSVWFPNIFLYLRKRVNTGTGSNACYVEKTENCELFDGDASKSELLINTEWGAFGDDGALDFVRTEFDRDVDNNSINPGKQM